MCEQNINNTCQQLFFLIFDFIKCFFDVEFTLPFRMFNYALDKKEITNVGIGRNDVFN